MPVDLVHWNPSRLVLPGRLGKVVPWRRPINNFGDLLGPIIVAQILSERRLVERTVQSSRLLTVGSIMKMSRPGDVIWGTGVNGKSMDVGGGAELDVRAVRGPKTREVLQAAGAQVPEVYGDPGLLWASFWPREQYLSEQGHGRIRGVTVVPNLHDWSSYSRRDGAISPRRAPSDVIREIALSDFVCGSSLHGIVLAESFGIPARLIAPKHEPRFKYDDYYQGTGRRGFSPAGSVEEAVAMGGEIAPVWDVDALLRAFPSDLWVESGQVPPESSSPEGALL
jgi:pyruvyltransferase